MKKFLLVAFIAFPLTGAFAQSQPADRKTKALATPEKNIPIKIISTDSTAKEDKKDNSWTFTRAKLLLHNTDTLSCDTMICRQENWMFISNVRVASPDGLILQTNRMVIHARPRK